MILIPILKNEIFYPVLITVLITQLIKVGVELFKSKKTNFRIFFSMGGMPSSHASAVTSLVTAIARYTPGGVSSNSFGSNLVFALIVMYDASGVRRSAGKNAAVLNRLVGHIKDFSIKKALEEGVGHTPLEVMIGAIVGLFLSWIMCYVLDPIR